METIFSENHKLRDSKTELHGGELVRPFDCPERMVFILTAIKKIGLGAITPPDLIGMKATEKIHSPDYLTFLQNAWDEWHASGYKGEAIPNIWPSRSMPSSYIPDCIEGKLGYYSLAGETAISAGTYQAALSAAHSAATAADRLASGKAKSVFALCRPPGHHASQDQFGGYCFLNNAAIAAQYLLDAGAKKVALLDIDFHHGNGTQAIFYDRADVFFLSLHGDPKIAFPYFLGHKDEKGTGKGTGFNANYPLPANTPCAKWLQALTHALAQINRFNADALVVSLGVDIFENDPISFFKLKSVDFTDIGQHLATLGLPTIFIMEGGYAVEEIGVNVVNVLTGFKAKST